MSPLFLSMWSSQLIWSFDWRPYAHIKWIHLSRRLGVKQKLIIFSVKLILNSFFHDPVVKPVPPPLPPLYWVQKDWEFQEHLQVERADPVCVLWISGLSFLVEHPFRLLCDVRRIPWKNNGPRPTWLVRDQRIPLLLLLATSLLLPSSTSSTLPRSVGLGCRKRLKEQSETL